MEIDVTRFADDDCEQWSASQCELGPDAGRITWEAALARVADDPLVTAEQQSDLRDWIREFGAWDDEEIARMSDQETNALLLQFVASDVRERESLGEDYDEELHGGRLHLADDGTWWFYVGM